MLRLLIDSVGTDPGTAFLSVDRGSDVQDPRLDGRFGRSGGGAYLETYNSYDMRVTGPQFDSVYVEASTRRAAIVKLLRALGYPRGTQFAIRYER